MPYTVFPPCEVEQKTIISWQFPNQSEQVYTEGDDYKVSLSFDSCNERIDVSIAYNCDVVEPDGSPGYSAEQFQEPNHGSVFINNIIRFYDLNNLLVPVSPTNGRTDRFVNLHHEYIGRFGTRSYDRESFAVTNRTNDFFVIDSLRNVRIIPAVPYFFDLCKKYTIEIYKAGLLVFSDEGKEEPVVSWQCDIAENECPENTCEVECGDTICCYGSDGISVFNFPKS